MSNSDYSKNSVKVLLERAFTPENIKRELVKLAVEAAELVLPIFEREFPEDKRPRNAIEAAKAWIADPSEENRNRAAADAAAADDAAAAAYAAAAAANRAADAATAAACAAAAWAAAANRAADAATAAACAAAARAAAENADHKIKARIAEIKERIDYLRSIK